MIVVRNTNLLIGSLLSLKGKLTNGSNNHPGIEYAKEELGTKKGCFMFYLTKGHCLVVSDPKIVQDMYTTQNKYFDKGSLF